MTVEHLVVITAIDLISKRRINEVMSVLKRKPEYPSHNLLLCILSVIIFSIYYYSAQQLYSYIYTVHVYTIGFE